MSGEIKINWDDVYMEGDINFIDNDLEEETGLATAVLISMFTDRRAEDGDIIDNENDKRGWWADNLTVDEDRIGSKLWMLDRGKATQQNINLAKAYTEECLEWMIEDGAAADVKVTVSSYGEFKKFLALKVEILQRSGDIITLKFDDLWEAMDNV